MKRQIPNILSAARFPLSVALLFLAKEHKIAFLAVYIAAGLSDVLDGRLARRYHWESEFGAKLDGFADIVFMLSLLGVVFGVLRLRPAEYVIIGVLVLAALKLVNLAYTRLKFKQWATMHTLANKYTALPFFVIIPLCVMQGAFDARLNFALLLMLGIVFVANLEETLILTRMTEYDADMKSYYHLIKNSGRTQRSD